MSGAEDTHNSFFTLETNGTLKTATVFDYESNASSYSIRVQVRDEFNASVEGNFTVTLTDVYEAPPGQSNNDGNSNSEGNTTTGITNPGVDGNSTNEGNVTIPSPVPDYFRPIVDTLPVGEVNRTMTQLHGAIVDAGAYPNAVRVLLSSSPIRGWGAALFVWWSNRMRRVFGGCFGFAGGEEICTGLMRSMRRAGWAGADFHDAGRGAVQVGSRPNRGRRRVGGRVRGWGLLSVFDGWARHETGLDLSGQDQAGRCLVVVGGWVGSGRMRACIRVCIPTKRQLALFLRFEGGQEAFSFMMARGG